MLERCEMAKESVDHWISQFEGALRSGADPIEVTVTSGDLIFIAELLKEINRFFEYDKTRRLPQHVVDKESEVILCASPLDVDELRVRIQKMIDSGAG